VSVDTDMLVQNPTAGPICNGAGWVCEEHPETVRVGRALATPTAIFSNRDIADVVAMRQMTRPDHLRQDLGRAHRQVGPHLADELAPSTDLLLDQHQPEQVIRRDDLNRGGHPVLACPVMAGSIDACRSE